MRLKWLLIILGLQVAWVGSTAIRQERALVSGQAVLLETRPVDPRDLLRGDYVILNYAASSLAGELFDPAELAALGPGSTVYVVLERKGEFHQPVRAGTIKPSLAPGQVLLRGRVEHQPASTGRPVRVLYGLERYYVREGTGNPRGRLTVEAVVAPSGKAAVRQVYVDGVPYADAMRDQGR